MRTFVTFTIIALLCGCKKDRSPDYQADVRNKEFSGTFRHPGLSCDVPVSIQFGDNGQVSFHHPDVNESGTYTIDPDGRLRGDLPDKELDFEMNLSQSRGPVTLTFTNEPQWTGIVTLNPPAGPLKENVLWQGAAQHCVGGAPKRYELAFGPNNTAVPEPQTTRWDPAPTYVRTGAVLRVSYTYLSEKRYEFMIILPGNTIQGMRASNGAFSHLFTLTPKL